MNEQPITGELRRAIKNSGQSLNYIAVNTGIDKGRLSRFVRAERGLSLASIDTLAVYFGMRLVKSRRRKGR